MTPFPLAYAWPQGLYLALYVVTLAAHAAFIGYVLAGSGYAAVAALRGRRDPVADVLRDWLPFALGAGITAGVAPLLFVQILYQERFYTANLLLFHRWMALVPALIAGFYLLYLHKAERVTRPGLRAAVIAAAALCFLFAAWSWTENHLLSLDDAIWRDFYGAGRMLYADPRLAPRLLTWVLASLPILAVGASWQVRATAAPAVRTLALLALIGIVGSTAGAFWQRALLAPAARASLESPSIVPWLVALAAARAAELAAYAQLVRVPDSRRALVVATVGGGLALVAGAVVRESLRLAALEPIRDGVAGAGGLPLFLAVFALMIGAIVWIGALVRRGLSPAR